MVSPPKKEEKRKLQTVNGCDNFPFPHGKNYEKKNKSSKSLKKIKGKSMNGTAELNSFYKQRKRRKKKHLKNYLQSF